MGDPFKKKSRGELKKTALSNQERIEELENENILLYERADGLQKDLSNQLTLITNKDTQITNLLNRVQQQDTRIQQLQGDVERLLEENQLERDRRFKMEESLLTGQLVYSWIGNLRSPSSGRTV